MFTLLIDLHELCLSHWVRPFLINNLVTIVQSFGSTNSEEGGGDSLAGRLVIMGSVCNCFGRLCSEVLVDKTTADAGREIVLMQSSVSLMSAGLAVTAYYGAVLKHQWR